MIRKIKYKKSLIWICIIVLSLQLVSATWIPAQSCAATQKFGVIWMTRDFSNNIMFFQEGGQEFTTNLVCGDNHFRNNLAMRCPTFPFSNYCPQREIILSQKFPISSLTCSYPYFYPNCILSGKEFTYNPYVNINYANTKCQKFKVYIRAEYGLGYSNWPYRQTIYLDRDQIINPSRHFINYYGRQYWYSSAPNYPDALWHNRFYLVVTTDLNDHIASTYSRLYHGTEGSGGLLYDLSCQNCADENWFPYVYPGGEPTPGGCCENGVSFYNPGPSYPCCHIGTPRTSGSTFPSGDGRTFICLNGKIQLCNLVPYYQDSDGDGYGNPAVSIEHCIKPKNYVPNDADCDDTNAGRHPGLGEIACDGIDQNCDGVDFIGTDADGDTYKIEGGACGLVDCDDSNNVIYPNAPELCDGIDNQCPGDAGYGIIDEDCNPSPVGWLDQASCTSISGWARDPDYQAPGEYIDVHFYADGSYSTGGTFIGSVTANQLSEPAVGGNGNHRFNMPTPAIILDGQPHDIYAFAINVPEGENPELSGVPQTITPIAEICGNGIDDDCDGLIDEDCCSDLDSDGYSTEGGACGLVDCDDNNAGAYPGAVEIACDGIDQNCDGMDYDGTDADGDGYKMEGGACGPMDCDDNDDEVHPGPEGDMSCINNINGEDCPGLYDSECNCIDLFNDDCPAVLPECLDQDCVQGNGCPGKMDTYCNCIDITGDNCPITPIDATNTAKCGNGHIETDYGEECDQFDYGEINNCQEWGSQYKSGALACNSTCGIIGCSEELCIPKPECNAVCQGSGYSNNDINCYFNDLCSISCGRKAKFEIDADNVITQKKIVMYQGKPVIVNIIVWE